MTAKPISINLTGGKSGGCASKAVELTSGDLWSDSSWSCRRSQQRAYYSSRLEEGPRKGVASKSRDLRSDQRQKSQSCLAFRTPPGVKLRGTSQEGTESWSGDAQHRKPGYSHLAQPAEPPYVDPHVRRCGRGGRATVPLSPFLWGGARS